LKAGMFITLAASHSPDHAADKHLALEEIFSDS
jgi:hypothetical protein